MAVSMIERSRLLESAGWNLCVDKTSDRFGYHHPDGRVFRDDIFLMSDDCFNIVLNPTPKSDLPLFDPIDREAAWLRDRRQHTYPA